MNLAIRDVRHNIGRFVLTTFGIGLLLMIVMGMGGIYRGLVEEATSLIKSVGADLWIVQHDTKGPFAEISRLPASVEDRVRSVPGVMTARRFVSHTIQREHEGESFRMVVQGLAWPDDRGEWLPLVAGRFLGAAHYEMLADKSLGFSLGEEIKLGKDSYRVVGLTSGMTYQSGDSMAFFTVRDAQAIQFDTVGETARLDRSARAARAATDDTVRAQPGLLDRAGGQASALAALSPPSVSAVLAWVKPGEDADKVAEAIKGWGDVSVHSSEKECDFLITGVVDKARRQLGLFRALLITISAVIMALIIYTLTLDKVHDIAVLKLIGSRNRVILGLILQQSLLLGGLGYGIAYLIGQQLFPYFPRRVVIAGDDLVSLAVIVVAISCFSSLLGIWKALKVQPNEVLS